MTGMSTRFTFDESNYSVNVYRFEAGLNQFEFDREEKKSTFKSL